MISNNVNIKLAIIVENLIFLDLFRKDGVIIHHFFRFLH